MNRLLLLRHAKSDWDDPALGDHARPLNARGHQAARAMGDFLRAKNITPDLVLVSSALRTRQTLEHLDLAPPPYGIVTLEQLYLAPPETILAAIAEATPDAGTILVLGHNPGLHELAAQLAACHSDSLNLHNSPKISGDEAVAWAGQRLLTGFPTGALAEFLVERPWQVLGRDPAAAGVSLVRLTTPRDLPQMAG